MKLLVKAVRNLLFLSNEHRGQLVIQSIISPHFMEPAVSSLCLQELTTRHYLEPDEFSPRPSSLHLEDQF